LRFIIKRLLEAIPTLLAIVTLSFFLIHYAPGSPFTSERVVPPAVLANLQAKYQMYEYLMSQYFLYLCDLLHGILGYSFRFTDFS
ncbi:oligopeptide transporter permease, partial [Marinomonas arenicola]